MWLLRETSAQGLFYAIDGGLEIDNHEHLQGNVYSLDRECSAKLEWWPDR